MQKHVIVYKKKDSFMDVKIKEKWTTEIGLEAVVKLVVNPRDHSFDHWCGYVEVPKDNRLFGKEYSEEFKDDFGEVCPVMEIAVHGGLTYSQKMHDEKGWWIGFDCTHHGDTLENCNKPYVKSECENLARQIRKYDVNKLKNLFDSLNEYAPQTLEGFMKKYLVQDPSVVTGKTNVETLKSTMSALKDSLYAAMDIPKIFLNRGSIK